MSLAEIIEEIDSLPMEERWKVLEHTRETFSNAPADETTLLERIRSRREMLGVTVSEEELQGFKRDGRS